MNTVNMPRKQREKTTIIKAMVLGKGRKTIFICLDPCTNRPHLRLELANEFYGNEK